MVMRMTREAYEELIRQNLEWLQRQPCSLEKDHIAVVLEASVESEYDLRARVADLEAERDRLHDAINIDRSGLGDSF